MGIDSVETLLRENLHWASGMARRHYRGYAWCEDLEAVAVESLWNHAGAYLELSWPQPFRQFASVRVLRDVHDAYRRLERQRFRRLGDAGRSHLTPVSLDEVGEDGERSLVEEIAAPEPDEDEAEALRAIPLVADERRRLVLVLTMADWCLAEIAEVLGVTESRVGQILRQASSDLRRKIEGIPTWKPPPPRSIGQLPKPGIVDAVPEVEAADLSDLMTTAEVAKTFRVSQRVVGNWAADGKVGSVRTPGGGLRILRSDVERLLRESYQPRGGAA